MQMREVGRVREQDQAVGSYPSRPSRRLRSVVLVLAVLAAAVGGSVALYSPTLAHGFLWDDYHQVHPFSTDDVLRAFAHSWDPTGIEAAFYRPLAVAWFAARFEWFGLNAPAYHAVSIALFAIDALLLAVLAARLTNNRTALIAVVLFVAHPSFPPSLVNWAANQPHLLQLQVLLLGAVWWTVCRSRSAVWWIPILVAQVVAFLIKEDGIMLFPAIVALQALSRLRWTESRILPPLPVLVGGGVIGIGLVWGRSLALQGLGGYHGVPSADVALTNLSKGLYEVFLQGPGHYGLGHAWRTMDAVRKAVALCSLLIGLGAVVAAVRRPARSGWFLVAAGLAIALLFDLPLLFAAKPSQYHFIALGAVLMLSGGLAVLYEAMPASWFRVGIAVLTVTLAGLMATATRQKLADGPMSEFMLATDKQVVGWKSVPEEVRTYLQRKAQMPAGAGAPAIEALPVVTFGAYGWDGEGASLRRWSSGHVTMLLAPSTRLLEQPVQALRPTRVDVYVAGRWTQTVSVERAWKDLVILLPRRAPILTAMHRVDLVISPTWKPTDEDPQTNDDRVLGLVMLPPKVSGLSH